MAEIRSVLLPCETKAREFDSKLLLACLLAERGMSVFVGSRNDMHSRLARFPRSIYLGKDVRHSSQRVVRILTGLGHRFLAHDEEAQFYYSRERYRQARVHPYVLKAAELLFAWGADNALAWRESGAYGDTPIVVSGNGRIDLMRPELQAMHAERVAELRERHGNFVLINTNFGSLNHFYTHLSALPSPEQFGFGATGWAAGLSRHRYAIFRAFLALLPRLAERFPETVFVLRPHPGENHDIWREAADKAPNIVVSNEGNVIAWIKASRMVIHNGCTTGLEAYILGGMPISFQPVTSPDYDLHLPNDLSLPACNESAIMELVADILVGKLTPAGLHTPGRQTIIDNHISAVSGPLASERMADTITEFAGRLPARHRSQLAARGIAAVHSELRAFYKRWHRNTPGHKSNAEYTRHRFPDTPLAEVEARVAKLASALDRFGGVAVSGHSPNIFKIAPVAPDARA
jgi:surface carbohydrate biosynthesis protein